MITSKCAVCRVTFEPLDEYDCICRPCAKSEELLDDVLMREEVYKLAEDYFADNYEDDSWPYS